jgi:osmoprotectant transport system permease protein
VIGAKNFSEQFILAALMVDRVERAGASARGRVGLGSVIAFRALAKSDVDAYVDYSGTIWANVMGRTDTPPREVVLDEMARWLAAERGVAMIGALGFENAYALAMRRDRAQALGIRTIEDLAQRAHELRMGGDLEFFARPEWNALRDGYDLRFAERRQFQPTFMYQAVVSGEVDVISAFSSDGRIEADDLVVLEDPRHLVLSYDAVILLAPDRAGDAVLRGALEPLVGAIPIELMRKANLMVDREQDKMTPRAAADWLARAAGIDAGSTQ